MSTSNTIAQNLATIAQAQWSAIQDGVLANVTTNPITYYPRRPWIDEPEGSVSFDYQNGVALGPVGGSQVIIDFYVPNGQDGVIKWLSNNTVFPFTDFSGDLQWQLFVNNRAVRLYDNMLAQKGSIGQPRQVSPIRIYSGNRVQAIVNHVANVTLNGNVISSLMGYFYPSQGAS